MALVAVSTITINSRPSPYVYTSTTLWKCIRKKRRRRRRRSENTVSDRV